MVGDLGCFKCRKAAVQVLCKCAKYLKCAKSKGVTKCTTCKQGMHWWKM
jgi:hypothetical protein